MSRPFRPRSPTSGPLPLRWSLVDGCSRSRADKDSHDSFGPQLYGRILAHGILVGELLDRPFDVGIHEVRVKLLRSEADYGAVGEHDGDVYH
jgi:hypothetical protein